jgi:hypothetical protein
MKRWIAERKLLYAVKNSNKKHEMVVRISAPYIIDEGSVDFPVTPGTSACIIEIICADLHLVETIYGADSLQALQLGSNIDPILKKLSKKYDLFFEDGEPYFDG